MRLKLSIYSIATEGDLSPASPANRNPLSHYTIPSLSIRIMQIRIGRSIIQLNFYCLMSDDFFENYKFLWLADLLFNACPVQYRFPRTSARGLMENLNLFDSEFSSEAPSQRRRVSIEIIHTPCGPASLLQNIVI